MQEENELEPYLALYIKFNLKKVIILNVKAKIIKFPPKYIEENIYNLGTDKVFFMRHKTQKFTLN